MVRYYRMANIDTNENTTVYEIGYLLAPTIPENEAVEIETSLHQHITDTDGVVLASQSPEMRELSYEIEVRDEGEKRQFSRGQFGWVQFQLKPEQVNEVESVFTKSDDVIRHLLITVDPEDVGVADEKVSDENEEEA